MEHETKLESFFQQAVDRALRDKGIEADTLTEHYLVQLLASYGTQPIDDSALGVKLMSAHEASPRERRERLREVGDTSLFISGFWAESFERKLVDVDYYIDVGESAYGLLARTGEGWTRDPYGDVYGTLAAQFERFVDALALISRWTMPSTPQDIVKMYERWMKTKSQWAGRRLAALGVVPQKGGTRPQ